MSYATVERQIRVLPEECLEEVSGYIEFLMFRQKKAKDNHRRLILESILGVWRAFRMV